MLPIQIIYAKVFRCHNKDDQIGLHRNINLFDPKKLRLNSIARISYTSSWCIRVTKIEAVGYHDQTQVICDHRMEISIGKKISRLPGFVYGFVDHKNKDLQTWRRI